MSGRIISLCLFLCLSSAHAAGLETCLIKPCTLVGDFDGDKKPDKATLMKSKWGKRGIQVHLFSTKKDIVVGADQGPCPGGCDLNIKNWSVIKSTPKSTAKTDFIQFDTEDSSNMLIWSEGKFSFWDFQYGLAKSYNIKFVNPSTTTLRVIVGKYDMDICNSVSMVNREKAEIDKCTKEMAIARASGDMPSKLEIFSNGTCKGESPGCKITISPTRIMVNNPSMRIYIDDKNRLFVGEMHEQEFLPLVKK